MIVRHRSPFARSPLATSFGVAAVPRAFIPRPLDRPLAAGSGDRLAAALGDACRRAPVVNAAWHDGALTLTVDLPGVPADAVDVTVTGRSLRLAARTDELTWERTLTLGASLDPESVTARHVDGRLTVTVASLASAAARRIAVSTTPSAPAIDPGADDAIDATSHDDMESTTAGRS